MDIYDSLLKMKGYTVFDNHNVLLYDGKFESSGWTLLPIHFLNGGYYKGYKNTYPKQGLLETIPIEPVDTKVHWQFIHDNFPFCDVCPHYKVNSVDSYFKIKGRFYDEAINIFGFNRFHGKKILEIGPGYGYLPWFLKKYNAKSSYYCADIVQRFNHNNFINLDGYSLSNIPGEYDFIVMCDVIQHIDETVLKIYIEEICGMLNKPGSLVIITDINDYQQYDYFFGKITYNIKIKDLLKYMEELGFKTSVNTFGDRGKVFEFTLN
jgi:hypothetical protein